MGETFTGEGSTSLEDELPHLVGAYTATTGVIEVPRDGVLEFVMSAGLGWTWKWLPNQTPVPIPKTWPVPSGAQISLIAPAANAGTLFIYYWHSKSRTGRGRVINGIGPVDSLQQSVSVTPSGKPMALSGNQTVDDGLTTALAAGVQLPNSATGVTVHVVANPANVGNVVIADTQAKAALLEAAGGGNPVSGSGIEDRTGICWVASSGSAQKAHSFRDT